MSRRSRLERFDVDGLWAFVARLLVELVDTVEGLLPVSFGFAAMLSLVVVELTPKGLAAGWRGVLAGIAGGAALMLALSVALGV